MDKELIRDYRELLVEEESLAGLDRALTLVEQVLGVHVVWDGKALELLGIPGKSRDPDGLVEALIRQHERFDSPELTSCKRRRRKRENIDRQARVLRTAYTVMVLPALVEGAEEEIRADRYSLFLDACLIVFHQAFFVLLPELRGREWEQERRLLLGSFRRFADHLPRVSDRYGVLALYYDALEDHDRAGRYYREALRAAHSDNHDFMTSVQTCWSFLVEHERLREALELLLETYPRVARQDLDEIHELIDSTFQLQQRYYEARLQAASQLIQRSTAARSGRLRGRDAGSA